MYVLSLSGWINIISDLFIWNYIVRENMTILVEVNGNQSGEGFLIVPLRDKTFAVPVGLMTDDGSSTRIKLRAADGANIVIDQSDIIVTPTEQFVNIHATSASSYRNDTVLQILTGPTVNTVFSLTAITFPQIWFKGRFQARFATDEDFYNEKRGTPNGWNFALEGEPDFVPVSSFKKCSLTFQPTWYLNPYLSFGHRYHIDLRTRYSILLVLDVFLLCMMPPLL
jgi:hypothetical protein